MDVKEVTFNDMPQVIGKIFQKIEHVEQMLNNMKAGLAIAKEVFPKPLGATKILGRLG